MSDDRAAILARIRAARADGPAPAAPAPIPVGPFTKEGFVASLEAGKATVARVAAHEAIPAEVARLCATRRLATRIAVEDGALAALPWAEAGCAAATGWEEGMDVAVTRCRAAVMETGQFMVANDTGGQAWLSLVAPTHVVVIEPGDLHHSLDDLPAMLGERPPTVATFVHGPSRTADIEQTLVTGAHGPCAVHAVLVGWDG